MEGAVPTQLFPSIFVRLLAQNLAVLHTGLSTPCPALCDFFAAKLDGVMKLVILALVTMI